MNYEVAKLEEERGRGRSASLTPTAAEPEPEPEGLGLQHWKPRVVRHMVCALEGYSHSIRISAQRRELGC